MITRSDPPALKPAVFHMLLALAEGATHGYAAMQAIREQSGGQIAIGTASFYRHLGKLMDDGLVTEVARPKEDDPRRGAYLSADAARTASACGRTRAARVAHRRD